MPQSDEFYWVRAFASETQEQAIAKIALEMAVKFSDQGATLFLETGSGLQAHLRGEPADAGVDIGDPTPGALRSTLETDYAVAARWDGATEAVLVFDEPLTQDVQASLKRVAPSIAIALRNARVFAEMDHLVDSEMRSAVEREDTIRMVLDSMGEGLVLVAPGGVISATRSACVEQWFGPVLPEQSLASYLFPSDSEYAEWFSLAWEQLEAGLLPFEAAAHQMPRRFEQSGSIYDLEYSAAASGDGAIVVKIVDVSERVRAEEATRQQRELVACVTHLLRDPEAARGMIDELETLMGRLTAGADREEFLRDLHTLKGTSAIFGFESFSQHCHELESDLQDANTLPEEGRLRELRAAWHGSINRVAGFLADVDRNEVRLSAAEHQALATGLAQHRDTSELLAMVESFRHERVGTLVKGAVLQAERIARDRKKEVAVSVVGADLRLAVESAWSLFNGLGHVVRNAADHGVECPEERIRAGKPVCGHIEIAVSRSAGMYSISVSDDGPGIDWDAVRNKARALGLPCGTREELEEALYANGLTTHAAADSVSGRGIGLSAFRSACIALGGGLSLTSSQAGTCWRAVIPAQPACLPQPLLNRSVRPHGLRSINPA